MSCLYLYFHREPSFTVTQYHTAALTPAYLMFTTHHVQLWHRSMKFKTKQKNHCSIPHDAKPPLGHADLLIKEVCVWYKCQLKTFMLDTAAIDAQGPPHRRAEGVLITACMCRHPPCRWTRSTVCCAFNLPLRVPHDCQLEHLSAETAPYGPTTSAQPAAQPTTHPSALSWRCSPSVRSPWHHSHTASKLFISRLSLMHLHNSYHKRSWNHQPPFLQHHFSGMLTRCMLVVVFHWKMSFFPPTFASCSEVRSLVSQRWHGRCCLLSCTCTHTRTHTHIQSSAVSRRQTRHSLTLRCSATRWRAAIRETL